MYLQDTKLFLHTLIFLLPVVEHDSAAPATCYGLTYILSLVFMGSLLVGMLLFHFMGEEAEALTDRLWILPKDSQLVRGRAGT